MVTLGIHGWLNTWNGYIGPFARHWAHDAAAALCDDGRIIAAAEEERFVRSKHINYFPLEAIRFCLEHCAIDLTEVQWIALASHHSDYRFMADAQRTFAWTGWDHRRNLFPSYKEMVAQILRREFQSDVSDKLVMVDHQYAHAQSAVSMSGFEESLVIVLDGWGDTRSGLIGSAAKGTLDVLSPIKASLGAFYAVGTYHLGYSSHDEYKVMGLAPYGDAKRFEREVIALFELLPAGLFHVNTSPLCFIESFGLPREPGQELEQRHMDIAATLQSVTEKIVLHVISHYRRLTKSRNLCLAGGVAQNSALNGRLLREGLFDDIFVQPAAYDAGLALGGALHVAFGNKSGGDQVGCSGDQFKIAPRPIRMPDCYLGRSIPDEIEQASRLAGWEHCITYERHDDIYGVTANLLSGGKVVGWMQGRSEFGPRALGNRSILADPRYIEVKEKVNSSVKMREGFRPFAPAITEDALHEYFVVPEGVNKLPFMSFLVPVREDKRKLLQAVTHVDGTARVQTVSKRENLQFWQLLTSFKEITSLPILLNTSFNVNQEPIVDSVDDALNCFFITGIDYLIIGHFLVKKTQTRRAAMEKLSFSLSPSVQLVESHSRSRARQVEIRDAHRNSSTVVSPSAAFVLRSMGSGVSFGQVCGEDMAQEDVLDVLFQLEELWKRRAITAMPAADNGDR